MMGELSLGVEKGTEVGYSRAADGTWYGHGLGEKLKEKTEEEKEGEERKIQRGAGGERVLHLRQRESYST